MPIRQRLSRRELVRRVHKLDLEPIVYTMTERSEPGRPRLDLAAADAQVDRYRLFLVLAGLYPDRRLVPTVEIDVVWQLHVLDSGKYAADTVTVFETELHRFPYLKPDDDRDETRLAAMHVETVRLLADEFSVPLGMEPAEAWAVFGRHADLLERPRPRREHPT